MARVYFINGFLDAGKTTFIKELLEQEYFQITGDTLLLVCEDGDVEYEQEFLDAHHVRMVPVEKEEDFNPDNLAEIEKLIKPKRVIIEFNGMWGRKNLQFPWYWEDVVEVSIFDATIFDIYTRNMRSLVSEQVRNALMAVINRCDGFTDKLGSFRRNLKAVNQELNVVFYDSNGEMSPRLEEDLPYDIEEDELEITSQTYATFYLDVMENLKRYLGKKVNFKGMIIKKSEDKPTSFIMGRFVMTCCSEDLSMFGFVCDYDKAEDYNLDDWVEASAVIEKDYIEKYDLWYPVLYVEEMTACKPPENEIVDVI